MTYLLLQGDARHLPLADASVHLIVTSPPYFGQRSYTDDGAHVAEQIGCEATPTEFLAALNDALKECWSVLHPSGSVWVNLGDKRAGSGAPGTTSGLGAARAQGSRTGIASSYTRAWLGRPKSKQLLPHRFAINCMDGAADPDGVGWIVRQDQIWHKTNGLPESVTDRTRDAHEYWFHLTKSGAYFHQQDTIREPYSPNSHPGRSDGDSSPYQHRLTALGRQRHGAIGSFDPALAHPLGKMPSSVWAIASEPLRPPKYLDVEHFAAFPSEWPRRLVLGYSPEGICTACGEGRRTIAAVTQHPYRAGGASGRPKRQDANGTHPHGFNAVGYPQTRSEAHLVGAVCACTPFEDRERPARGSNSGRNKDPRHAKWDGDPGGRRRTFDRVYLLDAWEPAPCTPAIVLDPFGGTGTVAAVAHALGRHGISIDLSADYQRLARWRIEESDLVAKVRARTFPELRRPRPIRPRRHGSAVQHSLF